MCYVVWGVDTSSESLSVRVVHSMRVGEIAEVARDSRGRGEFEKAVTTEITEMIGFFLIIRFF